VQRGCKRPTDHPAAEQVNHHRQVQPAFRCPKIRDVTDPFCIRFRDSNCRFKKLGAVGRPCAESVVTRTRRTGVTRMPSRRINRAMRLSLHEMPCAVNSSQTRGLPYVCPLASWVARIRRTRVLFCCSRWLGVRQVNA
jgi:hypothetical protein